MRGMRLDETEQTKAKLESAIVNMSPKESWNMAVFAISNMIGMAGLKGIEITIEDSFAIGSNDEKSEMKSTINGWFNSLNEKEPSE